jgi:trehalose/maltose hydrolase-like predicted phosphorylase
MEEGNLKAVPAAPREIGPEQLAQVEVVVYDWDGTAVPDRQSDASAFAALTERLAAADVWSVVVTGTNFGNIERQFVSRLSAKARSRLLVCANRGSEVFGFGDEGGPVLIWRRQATPEEEARLTATAEAVRDDLQRRTGLDIGVVYDRLNRRKIDLIPVPEWADPPKARIGELLVAVEQRLHAAGLGGGLLDAIELTRKAARERGLPDARITSDVKHVEVGLTDKGDAIAWLKRHFLQPRHIPLARVLIAGDEFGPIAGIPGSDDRMREEAPAALVVSVGSEPKGVPPGVVHLRGGPDRFIGLLEALLEARQESSPQDISQILDEAAAVEWSIEDQGYEPAFEPEIESRFALGNGFLGLRGSLDLPGEASQPRTYVAGVFDLADTPPYVAALTPGPDCLEVEVRLDGEPVSVDKGQVAELRRVLDMRRGVLRSYWSHVTERGKELRIESARLASLAHRNMGLQVVRLQCRQPGRVELYLRIADPKAGLERLRVERGLGVWQARYSRRAIAVAQHASLHSPASAVRSPDAGPLAEAWEFEAGGQPAEVARVFAVIRDGDTRAAADRARLLARRHHDPLQLYREHVRAWDERQRLSDFVIEGDEAAQRAMRFAIFHLNSAANPEDPYTSVAARGLTGDAYMGHVFWDTEIYLLPFYTVTWPEAARAMLMYRYHTLPGARAKAQRLGYRGALYAWESAASGDEETPSMAIGPENQIILIRSGIEAHHISADVAYAVWNYWQATGDSRFLKGAGAEILVETARFWASRARLEDDGQYHIRRVIGPDEYHEGVDDNAYTNEMARWNLETAASVFDLMARRWPRRLRELTREIGLQPDEPADWRRVAAGLTRCLDPATGVIEQFAGYDALEEIDLRQYASRTAPMDVVLGPERTRNSKVLKQADVVMLMALLGDRFPREVQEANFDYYEPRCGHGSSLSPPVHALMAARLDKMDLALRYFRQTAAIDMDDTLGNTFGGVHIAALGGQWQAAVMGFAGLRLAEDGIALEPRLPSGWKRVRFRAQWRGRVLAVSVADQEVEVTLEEGRRMRLWLDGEPHPLRPGQTLRLRTDHVAGRWRGVRRAS